MIVEWAEMACEPGMIASKPVWRTGEPLRPEVFAGIRRRELLEHCKWDPQVGDVSTLAPFPLIVRLEVWQWLAETAELLAAEALTAEMELLQKPELWARIGLPRRIRKALGEFPRVGLTPAAARAVRFDFHLTTEGWRISEANCDAPGGFTEASSFTQMMVAHYPGFKPAGDPVAAWCQAIIATAGEDATLALLSASGYMEDHQIMAYLAGHLNSHGCRTHLANPLQIRWRDGLAFLESSWHQGPLQAIVRFYQGEWIAQLPRSCGWSHFFAGGRTPVANPGSAIIPESKRFPLVWDNLQTPLPTWRKLLPETRDPRDAPWERDDGWLLKTALCNTGDTVSIRALLNDKQWRSVRREARWRAGAWVAQRRFECVPLATPLGPMYPCIGVYTIDGKAAGAYARMSPQPLIDFAAVDIALLIEDNPTLTIDA